MKTCRVLRSVAGRSLVILSLVMLAHADMKLVNYTIDDQLGDEVTGRLVDYNPPGFWAQGNGCDHCAFHPDNQTAFDGTWHDGSRYAQRDVEPLALTFKFNGTAIYLFNILVRLALTDVNVTLDGQLSSRYTVSPNISEQFQYDIPVFAQDNIPYGEHTIEMSAFGPNQTVVLFDYAIYTTNVTEANPTSLSPSPTGSSASDVTHIFHKTNAGAIAGGVVGGVVLVTAILLAYLWYRRSHGSRTITPFDVDTQKKRSSIVDDSNEDAKAIDIGQGAKGPEHVSHLVRDRSQPASSSSASVVGSTQLSDNELRQGIQALRIQLDVARAAQGLSVAGSVHPSQNSSSGKTSKTSALESEIQSLRAEVQQLRAHVQHDRRDSTPAPVSPANTDLIREIAMLRAEMDEMREISQGSLPSYSPPAQPLPGFSGFTQ